MFRAERFNFADTSVIEVGYVSTADNSEFAKAWPRFQMFHESSMVGRHVLPHLHEIGSQFVWRVGNSKHGVQGRHYSALSAGLTAERLRCAPVDVNALIDDSVGKIRVIPPSVN